MNLNTCIDNKYIYQYLSDISNPKGIIHICHGMAEHIKRYKWLINKLNKDGFHVISIDHRGHGNRIKNSLKGYFSDKNGWIHVVEDQINLTKEMQRKQEQGSVQLQGEAGELIIEEWLKDRFKLDDVAINMNENILILSATAPEIIVAAVAANIAWNKKSVQYV